jgi:hypothetical protein
VAGGPARFPSAQGESGFPLWGRAAPGSFLPSRSSAGRRAHFIRAAGLELDRAALNFNGDEIGWRRDRTGSRFSRRPPRDAKRKRKGWFRDCSAAVNRRAKRAAPRPPSSARSPHGRRHDGRQPRGAPRPAINSPSGDQSAYTPLKVRGAARGSSRGRTAARRRRRPRAIRINHRRASLSITGVPLEVRARSSAGAAMHRGRRTFWRTLL